uniref:RNA-directed DNA polymerase n=1 Tax=Trichogramma kaykai TaxID=54128 RepID=A0ABD2WD94_9HYME
MVASASAEEHTQHLEIVLSRLHKFNLRLNVPKCVFAKPEVTFLSHTISSQGFTPLKEKVQAIVDFPQPRNIDELRRFLGLLNFYRPFIRHAAVLAAPLTALITGAKKKDLTPILWSSEAAQAFAECKLALANATHLSFPQENAKIRLVTDASLIAAGAVLEQQSDLGWQPLDTHDGRRQSLLQICKLQPLPERSLRHGSRATGHQKQLLQTKACNLTASFLLVCASSLALIKSVLPPITPSPTASSSAGTGILKAR